MGDNGLAGSKRSSGLSDRTVTCVLGIVAALAVLLCSARGLGMDADSTEYLAGAVNLAHGHGLIGNAMKPFTLFGPALSGFVSIGVRLGMSAQTTDLIMNAASAVLTVILGRILLMRHVTDPRLVFGGSVFIAIGWPLVQVTSLAITEPETVVVVLLLTLVLERFQGTLRPSLTLVAVALLLNLAFFLRYAGLAFIPPAVIVVFCARRESYAFVRRIAYTSIAAFLALLGPVLWMVRNHSVDGSLLGPRSPSIFGVPSVVHQYILATGKLLLPGPHAFEEVEFGVAVVFFSLALGAMYRSRSGTTSRINFLGSWCVLLLLSVFYLAYLFAAELATSIDPIDSRLLVPIYVPGVILLTGFIEALFVSDSLSFRVRKYLRTALVGYLFVQVVISCTLVGDFAINGRDFTAAPWRTSTLVAASKSLKGVTIYYTNNTAGLWARLGRENILRLSSNVSTVRKELSCAGARVVFFKTPPGRYYGGSNAVTSATTSVKLKTLKVVLHAKVLFASSEGGILGPADRSVANVSCP